MSKLLVVKQDAKAFNAYFADDSTQGYYRVSDCVPIDIDELAKDWIKDCTAVTIYETTMIEKPFSEFLQERMK